MGRTPAGGVGEEVRLAELPARRRRVSAPPPESVVGRIGPPDEGLRTFIEEAVWRSLWEHVRSEGGREAGGLLVGRGRRGLAVVRGHLPAEGAEGGPGHLTFTPESWRAMADRLEERFPEEAVAGWYHSHPGLGVAPSGRDVFLHTRFFPEDWHVALVLDPRSGAAALYRRKGDGLVETGLALCRG